MIETHAHLNFPKFKEDLLETLQRAKENGIDQFINIGTDLKTCQQSIELSHQHPEIFAAIGIHPCYVEEHWNDEVLPFLGHKAQHETKVVAIGEIGIDYYRVPPETLSKKHPGKTNQELQQIAFREQIQLAKKLNKPFIIHCRNAQKTNWQNANSASSDIWKILNQENYFNCVFHCFAEDLEFAKKLWERGIYISFNGTITYPKNTELQEVARQCPPELYLLETDCPFLPPQSKRGQRNEPAYILEFADHLSKIRQVSTQQIAAETTNNSQKLFHLN